MSTSLSKIFQFTELVQECSSICLLGRQFWCIKVHVGSKTVCPRRRKLGIFKVLIGFTGFIRWNSCTEFYYTNFYYA